MYYCYVAICIINMIYELYLHDCLVCIILCILNAVYLYFIKKTFYLHYLLLDCGGQKVLVCYFVNSCLLLINL